MVQTAIVVAIHTQSGSIGNEGNLLFRLRDDMRYFKELTISKNSESQNMVIMGYQTWKSIPNKFKPLKDRINVILSKNHYNEMVNEIKDMENTHVINSFDSVETIINLYRNTLDNVFYIGGKRIYEYALQSGVDKLYITKIIHPKELLYICDTRLDKGLFTHYKIDKVFDEIKESNVLDYTTKKHIENVTYKYTIYTKI